MATNKFIELPLGYRRLFSGPLDVSMVMTSGERLSAVTESSDPNYGSRYAGQLVYDSDNQKLYVLNTAKNAWLEVGSSSTGVEQANTNLQSVSSSLHDQITAATDTAHTELTTLSSNVFGIISNFSLDTVGELASAVETLTAYNANNDFLSATNPTIESGDLKLASGIKMSDEQLVINSTRDVFANALYVGTGSNDYPRIDSQGVYTSATYYMSTDGAANVAGLTATSLEVASFKVDGTGKITNVLGITSQGAIDAGSHNISTTGTVEATTLSATGSVYGNNLSLTQGITSSGTNFKVDASGNVTAASLVIGAGTYKIESSGNATLSSTTVSDLTISGGPYKIESSGNAKLKDLTVESINNTGALSAAAGKFVVDGSGNVTVGVIGGAQADLTVTGNLSVLGTTTYLDTNVTTMSAVVAELNSDSATTLAVKQTGNYAIATFANSSGVQLTVSNNGSLSATQAATFDSTVNVGGKLTVTQDISSTNTVYASAAQFSTSLEVGSANTSVLFVEPSGVGIDTESLSGYSLNIGTAGGHGGTMYVGGSANFAAQANIIDADSTIGSGGAITNGSRIVNVNTLWQFISALDGGSF